LDDGSSRNATRQPQHLEKLSPACRHPRPKSGVCVADDVQKKPGDRANDTGNEAPENSITPLSVMGPSSDQLNERKRHSKRPKNCR